MVNLRSKSRASDRWMCVLTAVIHLPSVAFSEKLSVWSCRGLVMLVLVGEEACLLVVFPSVSRSAGCYELLSGKKGEGRVVMFIFCLNCSIRLSLPQEMHLVDSRSCS